MKKINLIIKINFLIHSRIGSEERPVIYKWIENLIGREIKVPLDFIAYILIIFFFQMAFFGSIAEVYAEGSITTYFIFSGLLLILTMSLLEIFIYYFHIQINPLLLKTLPLSKSTFVICTVIDHFVGLRLGTFLIFIILFLIFGNTYNDTFPLNHYIFPSMLYLNLYVILSFSFLLLKISLKRILNLKELKISLPLQVFFLLVFLIFLYNMSLENFNLNSMEPLLIFLKNYLIPCSIFSLLLWPFTIISVLITRSMSAF